MVPTLKLLQHRKHTLILNSAVEVSIEVTMNWDQKTQTKAEKHPLIIIAPQRNLTVGKKHSGM